jgi:hypothetical protein
MPTQAYVPLLGTSLFGDSWTMLNNSNDALRRMFEGSSEPTGTAVAPYMLWADTGNNLIKQRNAANDGWIVIGILGQANWGLLPKSGGTMTGSIAMGGFTITGLGLGTGTAAARQQEVDLKAPLAAPLLTGDAQVNQDPAGNNSLVRRSWSEGRYAKLTGSTLTGPLILAGNAAADLEAVPRQQMRDFLGFSTTAGHRHDGTDGRKVRGQDLDSTGQTVGNMMRANGSGGTIWANPTQATRISADPPVLVVSAQAFNASWQTVTLSPPAGAYNAVLRVFMDISSSPSSIRFRKNGATQDVPAQDWVFLTDQYFQVEINLDATFKFQWRTPTGTGNVSIWLDAYDVTMF